MEQPTNVNAVANCGDLQAKYRAEAAKTQNLRDRFTAADDRFKAAKKQLEACTMDLALNNQILQGLAGQIKAIPGCVIPN
jgi:hypothetical protein